MAYQSTAKSEVLFWLALHNRPWTNDQRKRHGLQNDDACTLYNQESETVDHLFAGCVVSREVWFLCVGAFIFAAIAGWSERRRLVHLVVEEAPVAGFGEAQRLRCLGAAGLLGTMKGA